MLANSYPVAGSHQDNGGSKEPRPSQPPLAVRAHGVRDTPPPLVEVHQHTCLLVRQLLTSSKLKDHSFLRPLSFRVRVCVTGGRGREGERITLGGVPVCVCMYVLYMCVYVSSCICMCVYMYMLFWQFYLVTKPKMQKNVNLAR